jgi:DNA-directed RNA polymerase subunit RPC12/RpoP
MVKELSFSLSQKFGYSKCRECGMKILWFGIIDGEEELKIMHQNPVEKYKAFCPYCGKKSLYQEE